MKTFQTQIQVRGYELDAYGHVNNAVYLNYAEFARWKMLEEATPDGVDYFKNRQLAPVVARVEVDYKEPCYLGDYLIVKTRLKEFRKRVAQFEHQVIREKDNKLAAIIIAYAVTVNLETKKSVSFPDDFTKYFGGDDLV